VSDPSRTNDRRWVVRGVHLLDADPDLGADLSEEERAQVARHLVLPTVVIEPGSWDVRDLDQTPGAEGGAHGLLVLSGVVAFNVAIAGRTCTRLILPQDLLLLDGVEDDVLPLQWGWSAIEQVTIAVFDRRLLVVGQRWPALMSAILKRGALQVRHALLQQAISQLPRVEDRLLGLLWAIADRQGVVRGDRIWVPLPVTHETLAQLIGARRPTVSLGLKKLAEAGLVIPDGNGWLIERDSLEAFHAAVAGNR
jgi:CRP-like cAMP-binding protein